MHNFFPCDACAYWLGMNPSCTTCEEARRDTPAFQEKIAQLFRARDERLNELGRVGRTPRIGLVGCGKAKREGVHLARDLYIGSLFRNAFAISQTAHDETYILSARHGLLKPDDRVESYNYSILDLGLSKRHGWGRGVLFHLQTLFPRAMRLEFILLAGAGYVSPIVDGAERERLEAWTFDDPMRGLGLFERMKWLAERSRGHVSETHSLQLIK